MRRIVFVLVATLVFVLECNRGGRCHSATVPQSQRWAHPQQNNRSEALLGGTALGSGLSRVNQLDWGPPDFQRRA